MRLLIVLCLLVFNVNCVFAADLIILHTNDIHAHDLPFTDKGEHIGGLPKIAHLVSSIKAEHKNVLVIDAGDFFQGTPLFQRYGGEVEIESMNKIGYDIVELGNHEFDKGAKYLANELKQAQFPLLACNLDCSAVPDLNHLVKPSLLKEISGEKYAFIGVITPDLEKKALNLNGVKVKAPGGDWLAPVAEQIKFYEKAGINKIIIVSHCGIQADEEMAKGLPSIDLIIGGHSHTRLTKPLWIKHADDTYTAIVQTGCYGRALGETEVSFDQAGHLLKSKTAYHLINLTSKIENDKNLETYLDEKEKPLLALRTEIVGFSAGTFWNRFASMSGDSAIGDLICDAIAEEGANNGVQITFQNRGGIRAKLEKGPISEEKIQEILPFDNKIIYATMTGAALTSLLERSLSGPCYGGFLDEHGLKIAYHPDRAPGKRLEYVLVQDASGKWLPIDLKTSYKIAVNDYNFKGGDGCDFSKATDVQYSGINLASALHDYLLKHKHIKPHWGNRIIVIDHSNTTAQAPFFPYGKNGANAPAIR